MMSTLANDLADKLAAEGERVLSFFSTLSDEHWTKQLYDHDGNKWSVRDALEHLVQAEATLLTMIERVAAGGAGAPDGFDIDGFNNAHTGSLAALDRPALLGAYRTQRARSAEFARALTDEQLARRGRHPALGDSAVSDMLKMLYLHNTLHLKDIKRLQ